MVGKKRRKDKDKDDRVQRESAPQNVTAALDRQGRKGRDGADIPSTDQLRRRKLPKTAAVTITKRSENFFYSEALRKTREISLPGLGIEHTRIRRALNGGLLLEIVGQESTTRADTPASQLKEVLNGEAMVARPVVKGEIRILGLNDSVLPEEVRAVISENSECLPEEVKVGLIRGAHGMAPARSGPCVP